MHAASSGDLDTLRFLVEDNGADVHAADQVTTCMVSRHWTAAHQDRLCRAKVFKGKTSSAASRSTGGRLHLSSLPCTSIPAPRHARRQACPVRFRHRPRSRAGQQLAPDEADDAHDTCKYTNRRTLTSARPRLTRTGPSVRPGPSRSCGTGPLESTLVTEVHEGPCSPGPSRGLGLGGFGVMPLVG